MKITRKEPPVIQAEDKWNEKTRILSYTYGRRPLIDIQIPGTAEPAYRRDSDGTLNSIPFIQQIYVMIKESVTAEVTFYLSDDAVNMRPRRAPSEHAILGHTGFPLLERVNGLYDISEDYLISWHGRNWEWKDSKLTRDENGNLIAHMSVELGAAAWFINFSPQLYRVHYGYKFHEPWKFRPDTSAISGWCSWEACRRNVSQKVLEKTAKFCADKFKPYGMKYIQLDDGFQDMPLPADPTKPIPHSWLCINDEKFPRGHEGILDAIKSNGMEPGIWTSVSIYNDDYPKYFIENLLTDENGVAILGDWIKYLLDCEPETLEIHVKPYYKKLSEMGYTYFKTDVTRHLYFDGIHKAVAAGQMSNQEAEDKYRAFLIAAREAMGDNAFWLLSWGVMMEGAGVVDACRISMDALPTWSGLRMQIIESARWWHTHRIVWQNDPDHVCVRSKFEWARSVLSTVSLTGGLFMLSDELTEYEDPKRVEMIQKCLPPLTTTAGETGPLDTEYAAFTWTKFHGFGVLDDPPYAAEDMSDEEAHEMAGWSPTMDDGHPLGGLWAFHQDTDAGRWCVMLRVGVFRLEPSIVTFDKLGLPKGEYVAFDFWSQKYIGRVNSEISCDGLALGDCQVIALRKVRDHIQFLSSTRHVSQDAVSVLKQEWDGSKLTLTLKGIPGTEEIYWFHAPNGEIMSIASCTGLKASIEEAQGEAVPIKISFSSEDAQLAIFCN